MKLKKEEALEIAKSFALKEYDNTDWPLNVNDTNIRLVKGDFGSNSLGLSEEHWSIVISTKNNDPSVAVMDPDHVIVLVDSFTGEAKWFPVM